MKHLRLIILLFSFASLFAQEDPFMLSRELYYNFSDPEQILFVLNDEFFSVRGKGSPAEALILESDYLFLKGMTLQRLDRKKEAEETFQRSFKAARDSVELEESVSGYRMLATAGFALSSVKGLGGIISMADELDYYTEKILELDPEDPLGRVIKSQRLIYAPRLFGGKPEEGIAYLQKNLPLLETLPKQIAFETLNALSHGWEKRKDREKARLYADQALALYPRNQDMLDWRKSLR